MEVINHPLFGNTLVIKQAVGPGELVLCEAPLIICKNTNDPSATFATQLPAVRDAFTAAPTEVQSKVMSMMCPLENLRKQQCDLMRDLEEAVQKFPESERRLLLKLGVIWLINAHSYLGQHSAIFELASKLAHSCEPNLFYASTKDGAHLRAIRLIGAGEVLSMAYIARELVQGTNVRRQALWDTKGFLCMCTRCVGPDISRLFPCPARCEGGYVGRTQPSLVSIAGVNPELNEKQVWRCSKCEKLFDGANVPLAEEERWRNSLRGLEVALASPEQNVQKLAALRQNPEEAFESVAAGVGSRHWLAQYKDRCLAEVYALDAMGAEMSAVTAGKFLTYSEQVMQPPIECGVWAVSLALKLHARAPSQPRVLELLKRVQYYAYLAAGPEARAVHEVKTRLRAAGITAQCELCPLAGSYRCARCSKPAYCSKDHQKLHWSKHKAQCQK